MGIMHDKMWQLVADSEFEVALASQTIETATGELRSLRDWKEVYPNHIIERHIPFVDYNLPEAGKAILQPYRDNRQSVMVLISEDWIKHLHKQLDVPGVKYVPPGLTFVSHYWTYLLEGYDLRVVERGKNKGMITKIKPKKITPYVPAVVAVMRRDIVRILGLSLSNVIGAPIRLASGTKTNLEVYVQLAYKHGISNEQIMERWLDDCRTFYEIHYGGQELIDLEVAKIEEWLKKLSLL